MANTYKDIVITPFRGDANNNPVIRLSSGDSTTNADMNVRFYAVSNGTLSFEGSSGQLFSVTNDLTGILFSVNDISGIPSLEIDANGKITMAAFGGNVGIGTSNSIYKLDVAGDMRVTGNVILGDSNTDTITINGTTITFGNNQSFDAGTLFIDAVNNRVGVGIVTPTSNLHVFGTANITSNLVVQGADVFVTMSGANTAVGTGANTYLLSVISGANTAVGTGANTYLLSVIAGANTAVGTGANAYAATVGTGANTYLLTVIAGANNAVGTGANAYAATVGTGANTFLLSVIGGSNTIVTAAFAKANAALPNTGGTISGDLVVQGNVTISGLTTYANTQTLLIGDNILTLNADLPSNVAPSENSGIEVDRGSSNNVAILWNESTDKWTFTNDGTNYLNIASTTDVGVAFDKANAANLLAFNTGIGANSYTDSTNTFLRSVISGANTAVGTGANTYLLTVIAGANTAVGTGANAYAATVGTGANTYLLTIIAGANAAVGTGANSYTDAANTFLRSVIAGANTAVGAGANAYTNAANAFLLSVIAGANAAVGTGANTVGGAAFSAANTAQTVAVAAFTKANTSSGAAYYQGNNGDVGAATGLGDIFRVHTNTLTANVTITSGNNAICAGPITIQSGKTLLIQANARVVIS